MTSKRKYELYTQLNPDHSLKKSLSRSEVRNIVKYPKSARSMSLLKTNSRKNSIKSIKPKNKISPHKKYRYSRYQLTLPYMINDSVSRITQKTNMEKYGFTLSHQLSASLILQCKFFTMELENIARNYYEELFLFISELIYITEPLEHETVYMEIETDKASVESLKKSAEPIPYSKREQSFNAKGGNGDNVLISNLIWVLEYGIPDSLHDFGKGRNGIFPSTIVSKNMSYAFLEMAERFLAGNYTTHFPNKSISTSDILYNYYSSSPANFEEQVKVSFLLGNICGDIDNIYYYFNEQIPSTWTTERTSFFDNSKPNSLNEFFEKLKADEYAYCILDACMSIQKETQWQSAITMLKSLCNLWDPAGAGDISAKELADGNWALGLQLVQESIKLPDGTSKILYNSITLDDSRTSMYDYVYSNLLNENCIPSIQFSLRLTKVGSNELTTQSYPQTGLTTTPDDRFITCLTINNICVDLPFGGFSVAILSYGLYYSETGKDYTNISSKNMPAYTNLKTVLNEIITILKSQQIDSDTIKTYLYIFITRLKSTGDHGSARTTLFFNEILHKKTLYLSGDQLAYVYSIALNIPTVARYYSSNTGIVDEDNDDQDDVCSRIHFLSVLLPERDPVISCQNKLNEIVIILDDVMRKMNISRTSPYSSPEELLNAITKSIDNAVSLLCANDTTETLKNNYVQSVESIQTILSNLPRIMAYLDNTEINVGNVYLYKDSILPLLKRYQDYIIYFLNFADIHRAQEETIMAQLREINNVIIINTDQIISNSPINAINVRASRSSKSAFTPVTWLKTLLNKNKNPDDFIVALKTQKKTETITYYDELQRIKKQFFEKTAKLSLMMKEKYGTSSPFIVEKTKETMQQYDTQLKNILEKDATPIGKTMLEIFGWVKPPVVAIPITEDGFSTDIEAEIIQNVQNVNNNDKLKPKMLNRIASGISNSFTDITKKTVKIIAKGFRSKEQTKGGNNYTRRTYFLRNSRNKKNRNYQSKKYGHISRVRKTRKNTKRPKYIKKNATRRHR